MIELEDLKIGDIVWIGRLEFGKKHTCIRSTCCQVKIREMTNSAIILENHSIDNKVWISDEVIYKHLYGNTMPMTLYATEEDLKDDWNSCVLNEIDALNSYYQKHLKAIKKKIKECLF